MTVVLTRGLAAAVLATLPSQYGLLYADLFVDIAVVVIVTTAIIATVGSMLIGRQKPSSLNGNSLNKAPSYLKRRLFPKKRQRH